MADTRNRTPFYGAVPTSKLQADHVFMADGSTLQEQADKKYELIETVTLEEDVQSIDITLSKNIEAVFVVFNIKTSTDNSYIQIFDNITAPRNLIASIQNAISTGDRFSFCHAVYKDGFLMPVYSANGTATINSNATLTTRHNAILPLSNYSINSLQINSLTTGVLIPTGSVITVYGIPA